MTFEKKIRRARIWMIAAAMADGIALGLAAGAVLCALSIIANKVALPVMPWKIVGAICAALVSAAGIFIMLARKPSLARAALALDERFGLNERFVSGLYSLRAQSSFSPAILSDAERVAGEVIPREVAQTNLKKPMALAFSAAIAALAVYHFAPELDLLRLKHNAAMKAVTTEAVARESKNLAELQKKLEQPANAVAPLQSSKNVAKDIAELQKQFAQGHAPNTRDAIAKLSSLASKIEQQKEQLKREAQASPGQQPKDTEAPGETAQLERDLKRGDMEKAKAELSRLQQQSVAPGRNPVDNERLGSELSHLGASIEGQEKLSAGLEEAGSALGANDPSKAGSGFDKAREALGEIASAQGEMRKLEEALTQVENSKSQLAAAENAAEAGEAGSGSEAAGGAGDEGKSGEGGGKGQMQSGGKEGKSGGSAQGQKSAQVGAKGSEGNPKGNKGTGGGSVNGGLQAGAQGGQQGENDQGGKEGQNGKPGGQQAGAQGTDSTGGSPGKFTVGSGSSGKPGGGKQEGQAAQAGEMTGAEGGASPAGNSGSQSASSSGAQGAGLSGNGSGNKGNGPEGGGRDWGVGTTNLGSDTGAAAQAKTHDARQSGRSSNWTEQFIKLYDARSMATKNYTVQAKGSIGEGQFDYSVDVEGQGRHENPNVAATKAFMDYRDAAKDSLAKDDIPMGYKQFVKDYFDSIEPPKQ